MGRAIIPVGKRHDIARGVAASLKESSGRLVQAAEMAAARLGVSKWTAIKFYYQLLDNESRGVADPFAGDSAFVRGSQRVNELRRKRYHVRISTDDAFVQRQQKFRRESLARHYRPYSVERSRRGVEFLLKRLLIFAKGRTKRDSGEPVTIDGALLSELWAEQGGRCPVSGLYMDHAASAKHPLVPSLDRIDPAGGYVPGNVRLVCYFVNLMKRDFPADEVEHILAMGSQHAAGLGSEQGPPLSPAAIAPKLVVCLRNAKRRSSAKQWPCDLTLQTLHDMYEDQQGRCALSGVLMNEAPLTSRAVSLDRIDSKRPYQRDNVHLVCLCMNIAKLDHPMHLFTSVLAMCSRRAGLD